ncbi:hypothetical protein HDK90DRAFT_108577 [Phyllosticta capitalensis]|uniref:Uncharacterized protein n=1 Tax=Phyllosticta capitalensis TaxID=121624 RepID=A0ABR1YAE5_9PEZI
MCAELLTPQPQQLQDCQVRAELRATLPNRHTLRPLQVQVGLLAVTITRATPAVSVQSESHTSQHRAFAHRCCSSQSSPLSLFFSISRIRPRSRSWPRRFCCPLSRIRPKSRHQCKKVGRTKSDRVRHRPLVHAQLLPHWQPLSDETKRENAQAAWLEYARWGRRGDGALSTILSIAQSPQPALKQLGTVCLADAIQPLSWAGQEDADDREKRGRWRAALLLMPSVFCPAATGAAASRQSSRPPPCLVRS